ncbi:Hvo_1808 family surface protein [Haloparvum alkalitolerans]|uniref:Hvo_1808 family surface protein n=1 Tax=Haloparvum alkalitolerans TaxID=1042953 RepID=UPI003CEF77D1
MRRVLTALVAALLVTALVAPAAVAASGPSANGAGTLSPSETPASTGLEDAPRSVQATDPAACEDESDNDLIGCWNGVHYSEDPDVDRSDGFNETELDRFADLQMARVEHLRNRTFREDVPVETISRTEYAESVGNGSSNATYERWNDQVWKGLFIIGEDGSSGEEIDSTLSGSVAGFYSPAQDRIVIVVPDGEEVQVSPATLLHELAHGMQDQYHDLTAPRYAGATQDADLGIDGIVEGEAAYLEARYAERCDDEWTCLDEPSSGDGGDGSASQPNLGILLVLLQPYSDGPAYVDELVAEEGWSAVAELMAAPPNASAETIRREPVAPTPIDFEDTAEGGWETYEGQGVDGADTVGEASIFAMFWYQQERYDADTIDRSLLFDTSHPYQDYSYVSPPSDGWANDELYPYRDDTGEEPRDGYVWVTEWESAEDAAQFHEAYLAMLAAHDATHRENGVREVTDGPFRGAYGIDRDGTTVTIAHGPDPDAVFELRPDIDLAEPEPTETGTDEPPADGEGDGTTEPTSSETTSDDAPGFGALAAAIAVVAATLVARRT